MLKFITAVILGALYVSLHFGDNYADMPVMGSVSAVAFAWTAILAIFGSAKAWGDRTNAVTEFMKKRSLILFEIISRIPVLRWCVLGIHREKTIIGISKGHTG